MLVRRERPRPGCTLRMAYVAGAALLGLGAQPLARGVAFAQTDVYRCPLTFVIEDSRIPPVGITELSFEVAYTPAELTFAGHGGEVDCSKLVENATATFTDADAGKLHASFTSETGLSSLITPLARCTTLSESIPVESSFTLKLLEELKLGGAEVTPPVPVEMILPELEDCETVTTTTSTSTTSTLPSAVCADATGDASITATDALLTLNAAVGLASCAQCACDVDGSAQITASDALFVLNYAVGVPVELECPPCS